MVSIRLILVILTATLMLALGAFASFNNPREKANRYFALMSVAVTGWLLANFMADAVLTQSLFWTRLTFFAITLTLVAFVLFTNAFPTISIRNKFFFSISVGIGLVISIVTFVTAFIPSIQVVNGVANVITGPLYPLFLIYFFFYLGLGILLLVLKLRQSHRAERNRIKFILFGIGFMALFAIPTNLILPLILGQNDLASYGSFAPLIFIGFTAYAIIRHRLFDIRIVIARSVAYTLLLLTLGISYGTVIFAFTRYFVPNSTTTTTDLWIYTSLAIVMAYTFQPLRRFFEQVTERIFYRDNYDSQVVLNNFSKILVSELDLDKILKHSLNALSTDLRIQYMQLAIFDREQVYKVEHHGKLPDRLMVGPEILRLDRSLLVADEIEVGSSRKELMDEHGIRVSLMLRTREQLVGYLLLGDKLSGEVYARKDIELLEIIAKQLAVAILNAKAYVEIQEFNQTLQARVDHATGRLRVANRHLRELDRVKDEFISMASHQLRTPLTTTKGYLSMLMEGDAGKLTKMQREFAGFAYDGSERMVQLISDLLDVSRLSAGRFIIEAKPVDISAVMKDEVRRLQHHADVKGIELSLVVPKEELPLVMLDDNKTRQVIMNFIDNAIYYTKAGQVKVTLGIKSGMIHLEVRDSGIGVPESAKKHLFTKFFRADNAQEVRPDGTGLGLFLAKQVIEEQGGTLVFSSTEGKGSTFGFDLPMVAAPQTVTKVSKSLV